MATPSTTNHNCLEHAKHNQEVCNHLHQVGQYSDWVVTTAFYSAIHYVRHTLFPNQYENPVTGKPQQFINFEDFCRASNSKFNGNKHRALEFLVEDILPEIIDDFQFLKDNCWTARYMNYKIDPKIAQESVAALDEISSICNP